MGYYRYLFLISFFLSNILWGEGERVEISPEKLIKTLRSADYQASLELTVIPEVTVSGEYVTVEVRLEKVVKGNFSGIVGRINKVTVDIEASSPIYEIVLEGEGYQQKKEGLGEAKFPKPLGNTTLSLIVKSKFFDDKQDFVFSFTIIPTPINIPHREISPPNPGSPNPVRRNFPISRPDSKKNLKVHPLSFAQQQKTMTVIVENMGEEPISQFTFKIEEAWPVIAAVREDLKGKMNWVSASFTVVSGAQLLKNNVIGPLQPGAKCTLRTFPVFEQAIKVRAMADYDNQIQESDESDNAQEMSVGNDFVVTELKEEDGWFVATIRNTGYVGETIVDAKIEVAFEYGRILYSPEEGNTEIRWTDMAKLYEESGSSPRHLIAYIPPGREIKVKTYTPVPIDVSHGRVKVDVNNDVTESDETNNQAEVTIAGNERLACVIIGNVDLPLGGFFTKQEEVEKQLRNIEKAYQTGIEVRNDLRQAGYRVLLLPLHERRSADSTLRILKERFYREIVANPKVKAFAFVGHGSSEDGTSFVMTGGPNEQDKYWAIAPTEVGKYRSSSETEILIFHCCWQGGAVNADTWKRAFKLKPDGFFYGPDNFTYADVMFQWQQQWQVPPKFSQ